MGLTVAFVVVVTGDFDVTFSLFETESEADRFGDTGLALLTTGFACFFPALAEPAAEDDFATFLVETGDLLTIVFGEVFICFLVVTLAVFGPLLGLTFFLRQLS
ncbi:MAG: hypothetical protein FJ219_02330 [Ignavibacteria bacterium]|nr:hypothetical protein [Ignavibacteria bacterium]